MNVPNVAAAPPGPSGASPPMQPLVDIPTVRRHLIMGFVWLLTSMGAGLLFSLQFLQRFPIVAEMLSPGRVRLVHTNIIAYGFLLNSFMGACYWIVPRLTGVPVWSQRICRWLFWAVQAADVALILMLLNGMAQAVEWGETPILLDPVIAIAAVTFFVNIGYPMLKVGKRPVYVTLWYFAAACVWTPLVYLMGNYLPQFFVPGAAGAAIAGLFIHDLVGLFVTPLGWGMMYYVVPLLLGRPIYSHALSLIGFWGLAFFYPLQGVHHFLWSPIPMYAQYGAVVSTVAIEIVVTTVIINFFMTLRGQMDKLRTDIGLRWFYTGMIFYFTTCLQCSFQVLLTVQKIIHFTDWVVGHAHLVMFGVFGFWLIGAIVYLWPKLCGRTWYSPALNSWNFWLSAIGLTLMFIDLTAAGLVQGFMWRDLAQWEKTVIASMPFWHARTLAGTMIVAGQLLQGFNMWLTARIPETPAAADKQAAPIAVAT
jgi:cytochrome c oxidase cbb3-type subunit 1